jgi:fatty-acid desaturase
MRILRIFGYDKTFTQPIVWVTTLVMVAFHIGALAALFVFRWKAFLLAMALCWVAGGFGIGMGYHRLLTHRMLGLVWDVKVQRLNPSEDKNVAVPRRLAA